MAIDVVTPVGRLVQGGITLEAQKNDDGTPKINSDGTPVKQCFLALAIAKTDPAFPAFYAQMVAVARSEFPHLFDAQGNCTHPQFAWKLQDGDGVDTSGKSVADKPGFAGHYILKMATQFLPACYNEGKFDATQRLQNPEQVIKRGYFIRCNVRIAGNGVSPNDRSKKPGIFLSPNLVSFVAFGEEIVGGPNAAAAFGAAAPVGVLPPGATAAPAIAGGAPAGLAPPPMPGALPTPAAAALPLPGAAAPLPMPGLPTPPPPAGPVYTMTAAAQGGTRQALLALGWTDDALIAQGLMVKS